MALKVNLNKGQTQGFQYTSIYFPLHYFRKKQIAVNATLGGDSKKSLISTSITYT